MEENEQLAIRRARTVAGMLEEQFGRYDTVIVAGGGDLGKVDIQVSWEGKRVALGEPDLP